MSEMEPAPEAAEEPAPAQPRTPATWAILAINTIVFLAAEASGGTTNIETLIRFGAADRDLVWAGEYWRFVTPMFLHIGWMHFLWNSLMMFPLCRRTEVELGTVRFVLIYLCTGIGASAVSMLCHDRVSAGASGAGFGLIGVSFVLDYRKLGTLSAFLGHKAIQQNLLMVAVWVGLGFMTTWMDNFAHLGGLGFGVLLGLLMTTELQGAAVQLARFGFGVLLAGTVLAAAYPWAGQQAIGRARKPYLAAMKAMESRDYAAAVRHFDEAEAGGIHSWELYHDRALAYWYQAVADPTRINAAMLEQAETDINKAINLMPNRPEPYTLRASIHQARGNIPAALADLRKALEVAPAAWENRKKVEQGIQELERRQP